MASRTSRMSRRNDDELENILVIPPDGGWGWVVVFSAFINNMIVDGIVYTFGIMIYELSVSFKTTIGRMAIAQAMLSALSFAMGPFVSALLNKFDFRWVALFGAILGGCGYLLCSLVYEFPYFLIGYGVILGIGLGVIYVPTIVIVGLYFAKLRALACGMATCGSGVGTLGLPPLIKYLFDCFGWRITFQIFIGLVMIAGISSLTFLPIKPQQAVSKSGRQSEMFSYDDDDENQKCSACCNCSYGNKNYPTTAELASADTEFTDARSEYMRSSKLSMVTRMTTASGGASPRCCWGYCMFCMCCGICQTDTRAMYRDDIFYGQSVVNLPKYKELASKQQKDIKGGTSSDSKRKQKLEQEKRRAEQLKKYHMSVTRATDGRELDENMCTCSISCIRTLATMLDFRLLKSPAFQLFAWSGLFVQFGYAIPFLFLKNRAVDQFAMKEELAVWLVSVVGISNTIGRIVCGVLPIIMPLNVTIYSYCCLAIAGAMTACSGFSGEIWFQFGFVASFGFLTACIAALRPIIVVELFGLENLTNAFGLQLIFMAVSAGAGPAVGGFCYDLTNDYNITFYLAGGNFLLSSLLMLPMKKTRDWEKRTGRMEI